MELESELDLPAEVPVGASCALQKAERRRDSGVGRIQNGRVEEVDGFAAELQLEAFSEVEEFGSAGIQTCATLDRAPCPRRRCQRCHQFPARSRPALNH